MKNPWQFYILLISLGILCFHPAISCAGTTEDNLLQQGNEAYSRGEYDQAIVYYQELTASAGLSASVLYNMANSYTHLGEIGRAVLNYERALRLAPGDPDIAGNLELVRKESGLFAGEYSGAERFFRILELNVWTKLIVLILASFTAFRLIALRHRFSTKVSSGIWVSCFLLLGLCITSVVYRYQNFNPAVVVARDARLLISPFESSASVGAIQEGRLVYPEKEHGDYTLVTDETKRKGWIARNSLETVGEWQKPLK